ncbi:PREDICTED: pentatricopeptide repeat-containing protein At4g35850, mitochondrial [Ipomoea nil]|uniref:pentatricopeptide repeat-containing protein At4g35850, mitochondrial n=1 Tax=Ipomoea nil TaxID=35883 RepID=UPI000901086B|nr:PREDICTED: pentatricopeptide repeat-containing protein At4g35850, mitochondrial [Ipomoea nil]
MRLLQTLASNNRLLLRGVGRRFFAASPEEYAKRNYANNDSEYNTVITSITSQRRHYLLRDVYDDMMLDGVKPERDTFHSLIVGTMKGARLQDALFFKDEMKAMGLVPDVALYNFLISTCGKCKNSDQAIRVLEEMKRSEVKPSGQTYVCLLNACAAEGRLDQVYAIVRDMTAAAVGLNKYCYAGLIAAHKNQEPLADDVASKIIELVEQSKSWSEVEAPRDIPQRFMTITSEEELYHTPTAEFVNRRAFLNKQLTVYHVAFHACADLKNVEAIDTLHQMLEKDGKTPDVFILMQLMRCYLHTGDLDRGLKVFEDYMNSERPPIIELYVTLIEGAMVGYTTRGMQIAQDTLLAMNQRNFTLSPKMGTDLLLAAAGEKSGGYTVANLLWDLMVGRNVNISLHAVEAYYQGLKDREVPADDPRRMLVEKTYNDLKRRFGRRTY